MVMINGLWETGDRPIKTFPLRGIKDAPGLNMSAARLRAEMDHPAYAARP